MLKKKKKFFEALDFYWPLSIFQGGQNFFSQREIFIFDLMDNRQS